MYQELIKNLSQYDMLNLGQIRDIQIPVPPLSEQQRIVSEVEKLETQISAAQQIIESSVEEKRKILEKYLN